MTAHDTRQPVPGRRVAAASQQALFEPPAPPKALARNVEPFQVYDGVTVYHGDCLEVMARMPASSVDAVVSDPPYGIGFMGREWDTFAVDAPNIVEASRRVNRMVESDNPNLRGRRRSPGLSPSAIDYNRDIDGQRGFQRFTAEWGAEAFRVLKPGGHALVCGAPRSAHRMFCGLEDAGFEVRDCLAWLFGQGFPKSRNLDGEWDGWGTALKPGHEPIALVRKPMALTVEENMATFSVGAINVDGCRIPIVDPKDRDPRDGFRGDVGRWPANVALDEEAAALLDEQSGVRKSGANPTKRSSAKFQRVFSGWPSGQECVPARGLDAGGASRFFFCPKPSRAERDFGCDEPRGNFHPTVKPVGLMRWLVRLITPPGGVVLDPFLGSGTTGIAALLERCAFIGIEKDPDYLELNTARIRAVWEEL